MSTVSEIEQGIAQKAHEARQSLDAAFSAIRGMLTEDIPKYSAMAQAIESDDLVKASMESVLPTKLRGALAAIVRIFASLPEIQEAARAEHAAANPPAPVDPTAPGSSPTAPSTDTGTAPDPAAAGTSESDGTAAP